MKVTHNYSQFSTEKKTIITIGTFDGVHIGHQKIISQLLNASKKKNEIAVLLTFFPHPRMVLQKDSKIKLINTIDEKTALLDKMGLDELIIHPFNRDFSRLSALEFVRNILVNKLNISKLIIGYDHHFGKNREGNFEQLIEYGTMFDFEVEEIPAQNINDVSVSSSKIRTSLLEGKIETANKYLGYNFMLTGKIVAGNNLGNKINFPTANIFIEEDYKLIPKNGVYIIKTFFSNQIYYGMLNIGNRPTVDGKKQTIEVNLFDFNRNIYGETIQIELLKFIREEQKFESIKDLRNQLIIDETEIKKIILKEFV